jgi:hypothetical protein
VPKSRVRCLAAEAGGVAAVALLLGSLAAAATAAAGVRCFAALATVGAAAPPLLAG